MENCWLLTSNGGNCPRTSPRLAETAFSSRLKRALPEASGGVSASALPPWQTMHGPGIALSPRPSMSTVFSRTPVATLKLKNFAKLAPPAGPGLNSMPATYTNAFGSRTIAASRLIGEKP